MTGHPQNPIWNSSEIGLNRAHEREFERPQQKRSRAIGSATARIQGFVALPGMFRLPGSDLDR